MNNKLKAVAAESRNKLLRKPGVTGVGTGKKIIDGIPTEEDAILVFVQHKQNMDTIRKQGVNADLVPDEIDGFQTDIIEVGHIQLHRGYRERSRPVQPGYSISHRNVTAGTIGGLFYDEDNDVVALSNYHVLADDGRAAIGDVIYQPGTADTNGSLEFNGWTNPYDKHAYIGTLKRFYPLDSNGHHTHDSAIAKIHPELVKGGYVNTIYPELGRPLTGFSNMNIGDSVVKCGRTTGFTNGRIIAHGVTFQIDYNFGKCTFTNITMSSAMSQPGDSGSLGLDQNMRAFGLLFAGSSKVTLYNDIEPIIEYYGLRPIIEPEGNCVHWSNMKWHTATTDGQIDVTGTDITFTDNAHHHCYIETNIPEFSGIEAIVNTGNDGGKTWGIGLGLSFPSINIRINLRTNGTYGVYINGVEDITVGKVLPNTTYKIGFMRNKDFWLGAIEGPDGNTVRLITIPISTTGLHPTCVRIGKMGINNGPVDYAIPGDVESGEIGTCRCLKLTYI